MTSALNEVCDARRLFSNCSKAQHEAENLKSVVVPLENEIADLKEKLKRAEEEILTLTPDEVFPYNTLK